MVNRYYRYVLHNKINGTYQGLFRGLGEYLAELYTNDDEIYDDFNSALHYLEDVLDVPDLDFGNNNYNFAFTQDAVKYYGDRVNYLQ